MKTASVTILCLIICFSSASSSFAPIRPGRERETDPEKRLAGRLDPVEDRRNPTLNSLISNSELLRGDPNLRLAWAQPAKGMTIRTRKMAELDLYIREALDLPPAERMEYLSQSGDVWGVAREGKRNFLWVETKTQQEVESEDPLFWGPEYAEVKRLLCIEQTGTGDNLKTKVVDAYKTLGGLCRDQVERESNDNKNGFSVLHYSGLIVLDFPGKRRVELTTSELMQLQAGTALPDDHLLSATLAVYKSKPLFLLQHPGMQTGGEALSNAEAVAFAIQRSYSDVRVYSGSSRGETDKRIAHLEDFKIESPNKLIALTAAKQFGIEDAKVIQNLSDELRARGVQVVDCEIGRPLGPTDSFGNDARAVIVITGHSSSELEHFVDHLGKLGAFKNKIVLFYSCQTALTKKCSLKINDKYEASGVFRLEGEVKATAVEDAVMELANELSKGDSTAKFHDQVIDVLQKCHLNGLPEVRNNRGTVRSKRHA